MIKNESSVTSENLQICLEHVLQELRIFQGFFERQDYPFMAFLLGFPLMQLEENLSAYSTGRINETYVEQNQDAAH